MFLYVKKIGITDLFIQIHPAHAKIYCDLYFFEFYGNERIMKKLNNKPTVLLHQNIDFTWNQLRSNEVLMENIYYEVNKFKFLNKSKFNEIVMEK